MADVAECITKLIANGAIHPHEIGDEALGMFQRSKAEYAKQMGSASADAAAALQAAKELHETAAKRQLAIAAGQVLGALHRQLNPPESVELRAQAVDRHERSPLTTAQEKTRLSSP